MNVLITGGLGYVGGRITKHLLENNGNNLYLTSRQQLKLPSNLLNREKVFIIHPDEIFSESKPFPNSFETIIHLAALNEIDCVKFPQKAIEFNIGKSVLLLQKAIQSGTSRFIYFSTAHIYGAPLEGVINEDTIPRPSHPYAITHKAVEDYVYAAHKEKQIDGISLRLSNSIGTPLIPEVNRWTLLVNDLCRQAVETGKLTLHSSGTQKRDFVTLEDVARCTTYFTTAGRELLQDGIFNLGGNCSMSVLSMAKMIQSSCTDVLGFTPEIVLPQQVSNNNPAADLHFSVSKLNAAGFELKGNFQQEIRQLLEFCKVHFSKQ